jgi:hypothetical protein
MPVYHMYVKRSSAPEVAEEVAVVIGQFWLEKPASLKVGAADSGCKINRLKWM